MRASDSLQPTGSGPDGLDPRLRDALFAAALNDIPSAIVAANTDRRIILVNRAFSAMFGYAAQEAIGRKSIILYESEAKFEAIGQERYQLAASANREPYVVNYRRKNGDVFPGETIGVPLHDADGKLLGFVAIIRDITDRFRAEAALKESEERNRLILEAAAEGIYGLDAQGNAIFVNPAGARMLGYAVEELLGCNAHETVHHSFPDGAPYASADCPAMQAMNSGEPVSVTDEVFWRKDGRPFWVEYATTPIVKANEIVGAVTTFQDVTERKKLHLALERLHSVTSSRRLNFGEKIRAILRLGVEHFDLAFGIVAHVENDVYTVRHCISPDGGLRPGQQFALGETYCVHTLEAGGPLGFHHAGASAIAAHPCYRTFGLEAYIGAPLLVDGVRYGTLNFSRPKPLGHPFDNSDLELVRLFAEWVGNEIARQRDIEELAAAQEELKRLAGTDELTDVANRRQVELLAGHEVERARRQRADMAVFVLDADHFKRVNDDHGHEAGDQVLRVIAQLAKAQLRSVDVFGRLGGEEFVGVLPDTPADVAAEVADRIREAIAEEIIPVASDGLSITVSIGVAGLLSTDETFREVLNRADRALYAAKGAGRNRVIHHDHMNE